MCYHVLVMPGGPRFCAISLRPTIASHARLPLTSIIPALLPRTVFAKGTRTPGGGGIRSMTIRSISEFFPAFLLTANCELMTVNCSFPLSPLFPLDTTIPPVSPLFPLDTKNGGCTPLPGITNRSNSAFSPARSSSDAFPSAAPLFSALPVSSVVKPPRRCILSRPFLATRHQPLATVFLTPTIPALLPRAVFAKGLPRAVFARGTRTPGGGGQKPCSRPHLASSITLGVSIYMLNVGAPTLLGRITRLQRRRKEPASRLATTKAKGERRGEVI